MNIEQLFQLKTESGQNINPVSRETLTDTVQYSPPPETPGSSRLGSSGNEVGISPW